MKCEGLAPRFLPGECIFESKAVNYERGWAMDSERPDSLSTIRLVVRHICGDWGDITGAFAEEQERELAAGGTVTSWFRCLPPLRKRFLERTGSIHPYFMEVPPSWKGIAMPHIMVSTDLKRDFTRVQVGALMPGEEMPRLVPLTALGFHESTWGMPPGYCRYRHDDSRPVG